jgi:hypothetical protein
MIYLIDDKKDRQQDDYGWNSEKLKKYIAILNPIYTYEEIKDLSKRNEIFSEDNILLFHESFFDNDKNAHYKDSVDIRSELNNYADDKKGWIVFFSGSKISRTLKDRVAHIPVSTLYNNLEYFIENIISQNSIDLNYLLFGGKNPEIEKQLLEKLNQANIQFDETPINSSRKNLIIKSGIRTNIPVMLIGSIEKTFRPRENFDFDITSSYLNDKVIEWFSTDEVDNIFIPLSFGTTLSDFNGLQFACHIRCTSTLNQLKPIYIYSFVDFSYIVDNEFFNILKTKNIFLIEYTRDAFEFALANKYEQLRIEQLPNEISKLKLDVPGNYYDQHSIANIWGMYRLLELEGIDSKSISTLNKERNNLNNLYFKYLKTINLSSKLVDEAVVDSRNEYRVTIGVKTVGKINLNNQRKK